MEIVDVLKGIGTDLKELLGQIRILMVGGRVPHPDKSQLSRIAKQEILDDDIRKNRPHVSSDTRAMVEIKRDIDGNVVHEEFTDGDAERARGLLDCNGKSCYDELMRVISLQIEGGLRPAELRAVRGKGGHVIGGRPSKAETVNAYALRVVDQDTDFERTVLRFTCLVGGRRYTYDGHFPTGTDPKCERRPRITQQGGVGRVGAQTGSFEYFPRGSRFVKGADEFEPEGRWVPIREVSQRQVYGKGLAAVAELESVPGEPQLRPQWRDPFRKSAA